MHDAFLKALARPEPVPGGGAAAAHGALVGVALLEKIVRLELQRQSIAPEIQSLLEKLLDQVCGLAQALLRLREEDGKAYMRFAEARASGKKEQYVEAALEQAVESPMQIMETGHEGLGSASLVGKHCKRHLVSDLLVVCELLQSATRGACRIAQANLILMADSSSRTDYQRTLSRLLHRCGEAFQQAERSMLRRAGVGGR